MGKAVHDATGTSGLQAAIKESVASAVREALDDALRPSLQAMVKEAVAEALGGLATEDESQAISPK